MFAFYSFRSFRILTLCVLVFCLTVPTLYSDEKPDPLSEESDADAYNSVYKLMFVIHKIRKEYVDKDKVSYPALMKGALKGMLRNLDPFCSYVDPANYKELLEDTEGKEYSGVGLIVTHKNNYLRVISPMEEEKSPGFKAGIKPGDVILKIDGHDTNTMTLDECIKLLKGEQGTKVSLLIYRESKDSTFDVTLERELIGVSTVKGAKIIEDGIGYLRITQFNMPTAEKLDESLDKLKKQDMKALILDLRGNPGGLLTSAIEVTSRFIDNGKLVVYTEGKEGEPSKHEYLALKCDKILDIPMAILIDGNSASASEIVSGSLKDHKRAFLVGEKTFGKALVQTVFPLPENNGAIRLTTAKYYTPSKRVIQDNGIEPDLKVEITPKTQDKIYSQRIIYPGIVKPEHPDSVRDTQLERAIETMKDVCIFKNRNG